MTVIRRYVERPYHHFPELLLKVVQVPCVVYCFLRYQSRCTSRYNYSGAVNYYFRQSILPFSNSGAIANSAEFQLEAFRLVAQFVAVCVYFFS